MGTIDQQELLTSNYKVAIAALEAIVNPIGHMKSKLDEGETLNGMFVMMVLGKAHYYQDIAKEALSKIEQNRLTV